MKAAALAVLLLSGCAGGLLRKGLTKTGIVLEAAADGPSSDEALAAAKRAAVDSVLDLYVSSAVRREDGGLLSQAVLGDAGRFIKDLKVLESGRNEASFHAKIRALVLYPQLGLELERLGIPGKMLGPGGPGLSLSISEDSAGRAAGALRRALALRGFPIVAPGKGPAAVHLAGRASARPIADRRLGSFHASNAAFDLAVATAASAAPILSFRQEASAVDVTAEGSSAKALENAGALMGEKAGDELASRYPARWELEAVVVGLKGLPQIRGFLAEARRLPQVKGLWLESIAPPELRLRLFSGVAADELAGSLVKMKGRPLKLAAVESDYLELEAEQD